jgi:ribonuclease P protein component
MRALKGNKNVGLLFSTGKRVSSSFLHCVYLLNHEGDSRFVVSVPKKNFSLAVDRNKIKRLMREIIRKNSVVLEAGGWFMFIYSSDKIVPLLDIENDFVILLEKIV